MPAPRTVLWARDEHTAAKHQMLRAYLDRWLPIMSRYQAELLLVDGFAGPGRYLDGEDGSPIIMLKAFLEHAHRAAIERSTLRYVFVENNQARLRNLQDEVARLGEIPANVRLTTIFGDYSDVMPGLLREVPNRVPTFAFLDPFGYAETKFTLTSEILGFPRCEVLIYFPTRFIARFVAQAEVARTFDLLFGGREWVEAIEVEGAARRESLRATFEAALRRSATHVRSFEIFTVEGGGYHLFFATNNPVGLTKMKEAMWKVDPEHGIAFHAERPSPQLTLFSPEPDTTALLKALRDQFGTAPFGFEDAARYTDLETEFLADAHLKRRTLAVAERDERLIVQRPAGGRRNSFPPGTILRFAE